MNNKVKRIITIFATVLCIVMIATTCLADDIDPSKINGKDSSVDVTKVQNIGNAIATIIRNVGIVAAVIILMILGVKYMIGSAEEKAEYKKTMIPYLVGAVILFGASGIAQAVVTFSKGLAGGN